MVDLRLMLTAQVNAMTVLKVSAMPESEQNQLIETMSNLLGLGLNMAQTQYNLTDDESMSLLTLIVMRIMEVVDEHS